MLKTTLVKLLVKDSVSISEGNIIDRVDSNVNKLGKAKSKNMVICDFLAKSKSFIKLSSRSSFLTLKARLAFIKLRQAFIKALIFHYFDLEYYILFETNVLGYAIDKLFSQLDLNNLDQ